METYYIHRNQGNSVFVKEGSFFEEQGGLVDDWGKGWKKVYADSIEHARLIGETTLPKHKTWFESYMEQL